MSDETKPTEPGTYQEAPEVMDQLFPGLRPWAQGAYFDQINTLHGQRIMLSGETAPRRSEGSPIMPPTCQQELHLLSLNPFDPTKYQTPYTEYRDSWSIVEREPAVDGVVMNADGQLTVESLPASFFTTDLFDPTKYEPTSNYTLPNFWQAERIPDIDGDQAEIDAAAEQHEQAVDRVQRQIDDAR